MARKRFTAAEKVAFTIGTQVEWRNVTQWHPAVVIGEMYVDDIYGQTINVRTLSCTRTFGSGQIIPTGPTAIRLPAN